MIGRLVGWLAVRLGVSLLVDCSIGWFGILVALFVGLAGWLVAVCWVLGRLADGLVRSLVG